jgi:oligopeptide transport system ATP-binding protein
MTQTLLKVEDLRVHFPVRASGTWGARYIPLKAVDGVSFEIAEGEALGVVGESGCGKSTLGRAVLRLVKATSGRVVCMGRDLLSVDDEELRAMRRQIQIVFQDPLSSHNPRMTVGRIIGEPLGLFHPEMSAERRRDEVLEMMLAVGLNPELENRYPHELSGGQSQRVSIARAMILRPRLVVCDEPVSALDVSTQAQVVNLIKKLKREFGVAILFISHDLSVVRQLCDRILVMYLGHVVEIGERHALFDEPLHPYTQALIAAVPVPDPARQRNKPKVPISGDLPSPMDPPSGCVFRTRCPFASPACLKKAPDPEVIDGHMVACHFWREIRTGEHQPNRPEPAHG